MREPHTYDLFIIPSLASTFETFFESSLFILSHHRFISPSSRNAPEVPEQIYKAINKGVHVVAYIKSKQRRREKMNRRDMIT